MVESRTNIAIIGGINEVGLECLKTILNMGVYKVKMIVNDSKILKDYQGNSNLEIIIGDFLDAKKIEETVKNTNCVINCLTQSDGSNKEICSKGTELILAEMKKAEVDRIIACTSLGCGDSYDKISLTVKLVVWAFIKDVIKDKNKAEELIMTSGYKFTIVRPCRIMEWGYTGNYQVGYDISEGEVSKVDVADFIVKNAFSDEYVGKTPTIVGKKK